MRKRLVSVAVAYVVAQWFERLKRRELEKEIAG